MAKTEKEQAHSAEEKQEAISIETAKVIQGISLVFSGAVTMLEALHPHVSLEPSAILHLVTGNIEGLEAMAAEKQAKEEHENAETNMWRENDPKLHSGARAPAGLALLPGERQRSVQELFY